MVFQSEPDRRLPIPWIILRSKQDSEIFVDTFFVEHTEFSRKGPVKDLDISHRFRDIGKKVGILFHYITSKIV